MAETKAMELDLENEIEKTKKEGRYTLIVINIKKWSLPVLLSLLYFFSTYLTEKKKLLDKTCKHG